MDKIAFENKKPAMLTHGGRNVPARDVMLRYPITLFLRLEQ